MALSRDPIPELKRQLAREILALVGLIRILAHVDRRVDITVVNEGPAILRWFDFSRSAGAKGKAP